MNRRLADMGQGYMKNKLSGVMNEVGNVKEPRSAGWTHLLAKKQKIKLFKNGGEIDKPNTSLM